MQITNWRRIRPVSPFRSLLLVMALASASFAALGGDASSVEADRAKMEATLETTNTAAYTVHLMKTPSGIVIREYASPSGRIFGVTWIGPFVPDLVQLLGTYLPQYAAGVSAHRAASGPGRSPLHIAQPGFVFHSSGHMRSYSGRTYDPTLFPQGVTENDLR